MFALAIKSPDSGRTTPPDLDPVNSRSRRYGAVECRLPERVLLPQSSRLPRPPREPKNGDRANACN